jgi:hypothetical protein
VRLVPSADAIGGANGQTTWDTHLVEIRSDMDEAARTKTLIHELLTAPMSGLSGNHLSIAHTTRRCVVASR